MEEAELPEVALDYNRHIVPEWLLRGRRHRKKAIGMLLAQANAAMGATPRTGGGRVAAWAMSQAVPMLLRKADGRVLVWVWKDDPELVVALAQVQQATPQLRAARAMMPMEYDDTEDFRSPFLGAGAHRPGHRGGPRPRPSYLRRPRRPAAATAAP